MARGLLPAEPFLLVGQQAIADPSRSPLATTPPGPTPTCPARSAAMPAGTSPARGTTPSPEAFADRMQAQLKRLAPGFEALVRKRHVPAPPSSRSTTRT